MSKSSFSSQISKLQLEILDSSFQNRLLNFPAQNVLQSPLIKESSDLFIDNWTKSGKSFPLKSFFPNDSSAFFEQVLKRKQEDFGVTDLYLAAGFLKWTGNKMAPVLLIPLKVDLESLSVELSDLAPIENIPLREQVKSEVLLPKITDVLVNDRPDFEKYFGMVEMAISKQPLWKFSRRGLCLSFFSTSHFYLYRQFDLIQNSESHKLQENSLFSKLFDDEGFRVATSVFDEKEPNEAYQPSDRAFLYPTDFNTIKAAVDALNPKNEAYVIQTPPGTFAFETAANIIADSLHNHQKTLVLTKRAASTQNIKKMLFPEYFSSKGDSRLEIQDNLNKVRTDLIAYYKIVNSETVSGQISLSELFEEKLNTPPVYNRVPDSVFNGIEKLQFKEYKAVKKTVETLIHEFSNPTTQKALETFKSCNIKVLDKEQQNALAQLLSPAIESIDFLTPFIDILEAENVFNEALTLETIKPVFSIIQNYFDKDTPSYEGWDLESSDWDNYSENLLQLPVSGSIWARYRRDGSLIYTEAAIDESVLAIRDEFAEITKNSFKAFSDNYRSRKKKLLTLFKEPKEIESDDELIILIDELIELQNHRNFYKNSAPMANRLFGKDWKYEKSNWVLLHVKEKYFFDLKNKIKDPQTASLAFKILEKHHLFKNLDYDIQTIETQLKNIQNNCIKISKLLSLINPLDTIPLKEQGNLLRNWMDGLSDLDIQVKTNAWIDRLKQKGLLTLVDYIFDKTKPKEELITSLTEYWCQYQIDELTKQKKDLFSLSSQKNSQLSKNYRSLIDDYCNANFRFIEDTIQKFPDSLQILNVCDYYSISQKKSQKYDVVIILDAEIISTAECIPAILSSDKMIVMGDVENPDLELLFTDGFENSDTPQKISISKQKNILSLLLQKGAGFRTLSFSRLYQHPALFHFINEAFYNNTIQQFPLPHKSNFKGLGLKKVVDPVQSIAELAIQHLKTKPAQTLGIIAFTENQCQEIRKKLEDQIEDSSLLKRVFDIKNLSRYCFIKTPERATGLYRDTILVCAEQDLDFNSSISKGKIKVCASLAKQEVQVFISTIQDQASTPKNELLYSWFDYLQKYKTLEFYQIKEVQTPLLRYIQSVFDKNEISYEVGWSLNNISICLCVYDNNNPNHFLAAIEDDSYPKYLKESVEDIEYIRPLSLSNLGWKILNIWSPIWISSIQDETDHLLASISIEQSVAPIQESSSSTDTQTESSIEETTVPEIPIEPYIIKNPQIEGTEHHKPIPELSLKSIISQLLFYIDKESPIHSDCLRRRILNLHQLDREGPKITQILDNALKQGIQAKAFVKTGPFYYSMKQKEIKLRYRGDLNPNERKLSYVSPEERALLPSSMDNASLRQFLGLLE